MREVREEEEVDEVEEEVEADDNGKGLLVYGGRVGEPEVDNMPGRRAPAPPKPPGSGQPPTKYTKKTRSTRNWINNGLTTWR